MKQPARLVLRDRDLSILRMAFEYRAYAKLKDEESQLAEGAEQSELSLRLNRRFVSALQSLDEEERDVQKQLTLSSDGDKFYELATDLLTNASGEVVHFAAKSPILLLPKELHTDRRKAYHTRH